MQVHRVNRRLVSRAICADKPVAGRQTKTLKHYFTQRPKPMRDAAKET